MSREADLIMLNTPSEWPSVVLPLTKAMPDYGPPNVGLVVACRHTVYHVNMFALADGALDPQLERAEKSVYASYEDMLDDGWEVD